MNNQEKLYKVGAWVGITLAVFLALLSIKEIVSLQYVGKSAPVSTSISVSGKGEVLSIPDIATFSFSVTETAKTVKEAQTKATEKTAVALQAVRNGGVIEKDIKTTSYSINPHYEYSQGICTTYGCPSGKSVLTGYDVAQTIEIKVRDLAKAGDLFDSIGKAGVQNVNGLSFSIDDIDSIRAKARVEAIANAKSKAEKIAKDLGVKIVKITGYYDSSDEQSYLYGRGGGNADVAVMSAKVAAAPEIPKGEQKVIATVSITYEIR
jgi:uncharacterized protein YggE